MIAYSITYTIQYDKTKEEKKELVDARNLKSAKKKIENKISKRIGKHRFIHIVDSHIIGYY